MAEQITIAKIDKLITIYSKILYLKSRDLLKMQLDALVKLIEKKAFFTGLIDPP